MTYFSVLTLYILPPILLLVGPAIRILSGKGEVQDRLIRRNTIRVIGFHILLALGYTTPWDNYLVATRVWWYVPALVAGPRLGWVPLEEYLFFILQTALTALWWVVIFHRSLPTSDDQHAGLRWTASVAVGLLWLLSAGLLASGWQPGIYMGLILVWGLPPLLIQFAFGADILALDVNRLAIAVLVPTFFLWGVDAIAIQGGAWIISPDKTIGLKLGALPLEEMLFFFITNLIVVSGMTLMLAPCSQRRAKVLLVQLANRFRNIASRSGST